MKTVMPNDPATRLERLCSPPLGDRPGDWIRFAPPAAGLERVEARLSGHAFDPHRHDTYTIGFTQHGVQEFRYRGAAWQSVRGQTFVLHPDEVHDGHAVSEAGFRYRVVYVSPEAIHEALEDSRVPLPFVRDAVTVHRAVAAALAPALEDLDAPLEEVERDGIVLSLADALASADRSIPQRALTARHWRAAGIARDLLAANVETGVHSVDLEAATGMTRYSLARHFHACFGTSPHRYLVMRRLDRAREEIRRGAALSDAAAASGFADQSHLTRHFKRAYGMTPGQWAALAG